jgi:MFS family permease
MPVGLRRMPLTWAIYAASGAWASFVYLSGPASPVITQDFGVPAASVGLVGTALAAGIASASLTGPVAVRRFGRDTAMRLGLAVLAAATAGAATLPRLLDGWVAYAVILALVWLGSIGGATVLNVSTARLAEIHPQHSAFAITEANAAAAWVGLFSPLLLGLALGAGLGWWVGFAICLVAVLAALAGLVIADKLQHARRNSSESWSNRTLAAADELYQRQLDAEPQAALTATDRLPRRFWVAMVALFAAAGSEFAINFWGSPLIQIQTGAETSAATAAMSASVAGIAVGRTAGSRVTHRLGAHRMLIGGFVLTMVGFAILWLATSLPLAILGLFVAGLGLATLFPLVIDRGLVLSGGQPERAMARASVVLGLAIGGAPFLLGALGSVVPVSTAMLLVPLIAALGVVGVLGSRPRVR